MSICQYLSVVNEASDHPVYQLNFIVFKSHTRHAYMLLECSIADGAVYRYVGW